MTSSKEKLIHDIESLTDAELETLLLMLPDDIQNSFCTFSQCSSAVPLSE